MIVVEYDKPVEVGHEEYSKIMRIFAGIVAGRQEEGKYYIKCWLMKYSDKLSKYLNNL